MVGPWSANGSVALFGEGISVIVEMRTYATQIGMVPTYVKLYEAEGLPIQTRYLGNLLGWFFTEIGPLNQIVHMWGYSDLNDRATRRAAMLADPAWQEFMKKAQPLLVSMESKILNCAPFSPIR